MGLDVHPIELLVTAVVIWVADGTGLKPGANENGTDATDGEGTGGIRQLSKSIQANGFITALCVIATTILFIVPLKPE